ncbi:MAG: hypothetical protein HOG63_05905, partial [Nitrospina sp.]|nr:hypothetical protein [Nitrospina sp.]
MVKKTKKIKRKFGEDSTFGRMYEFRGVRYWLYRRKDNFGACTGNYHTKIRVEGEPEVRRSCRNSDFEQSRNKVHEMIIEFLVTGQTLRSRPFKFVSKHFLEEMEKDSEILESEKKKLTREEKKELGFEFRHILSKYNLEHDAEKEL